eukprot:13202449-Alexandrium_andersonii.AAC.1
MMRSRRPLCGGGAWRGHRGHPAGVVVLLHIRSVLVACLVCSSDVDAPPGQGRHDVEKAGHQ